jgi:acylphosphatase
MEAEDQAWRWVVVGRVQGVGFRHYALQAARSLGVRGWVRNLPEGSVEVQVAGPAEVLQQLKQALLRGPRGARVEDIEEERLVQVPTWRSFNVVF